MTKTIRNKRASAARRAHRVRARIRGTKEAPRLSVKRSAKHIYAQLIDDDARRTLCASSDLEAKASGKPLEVAKAVGRALGEKAKALGVSMAVFDRGSYRYHGRVAALADGAREVGLNF
ncbi:50S ribosomal protein L18 [Candidatus Uhrbacteria bacterium RIFCSPHIGHO2_01_FULL_63_20]|uniref:Large ribosomal subunit protein uL18 n=1 Tax=Candidatus Uhrbacteria bacterium RIFCSPHIGHO2_01_FULL_63_20 TaxID=1802385 RepID=A0A1F7TMG0_9BACT|nr:MAG: 50S ribosomal protein L18 [Candidatus Uhrbacteria bacterium RIFCSPHIGHO2_01_FULL_63_20]